MNADPRSGAPVEYTDAAFPVSVVMERREKRRGRWKYTEWIATGVLVGARMGGRPERRLVHEDEECRRYLWSNFVIQLHKDGAESYWSNLMAANPSLFVVCRDDEESGDLKPFMVTANYDEIIGYLEVDDKVFPMPIPAEVYQWLERFILNNYVPPERRKRKRVDWDASSDEQTPPAARRH